VCALETAVSTFDGFGRAYCKAHAAQSANPDQARNISFQNLAKARTTFQSVLSQDIAQGLTIEEWEFVLRCFQKRHLFAHKMGIVDDAYLKMTADPGAIVGRKIKVTPDEIRKLISLLIRIGEQF